MKYYYLKKDKLENNKVHIVKQTTKPIEDYKTSLGNNVVEYVTEDTKNIPNNWGFLSTTETLYDKDTQPSPLHVYSEDGWVIESLENYREYIEGLLKTVKEDTISEDILYNEKYIQVRDEDDLSNLTDILSTLGDEDTVDWISSDNTLITLSASDIESILATYKTRKKEAYNMYIKERFYLQNTEDISEIQEHFAYLL